jgi:hypothetical protein
MPTSNQAFVPEREALWLFDETDDSRFGLIGSEAIMVWHGQRPGYLATRFP